MRKKRQVHKLFSVFSASGATFHVSAGRYRTSVGGNTASPSSARRGKRQGRLHNGMLSCDNGSGTPHRAESTVSRSCVAAYTAVGNKYGDIRRRTRESSVSDGSYYYE